MTNDIKEEFDNFKFFNRVKNRYQKLSQKYKKHGEIGNSVAFEYIYHYYSKFGWSFLRKKANLIKSEKFKILVLDTIEACEEYEKYTYSNFMDFILENNIKLKEPFDSKKIDIPCNIHSIYRYIEDWNKEQNEDEFSKKLALLVSFYSQDRYEPTDSEDHNNCADFIYGIVVKVLQNREINKKTATLNSLSIYLRKLNQGDYQELGIYFSKFIKKYSKELLYILDDGIMAIPWTSVFFLNDAILLFHPNYPIGSNKKPLRIEVKHAKKAFNNIKTIFIKSLPEIIVESSKGEIKSVVNMPNIGECIQLLDEHIRGISKHNMTLNLKEKVKTQAANTAEIYEYISSLKSEYLDYLADRHICDYKIVYSVEIRQNNNDINLEEDAFIFVLKESQDSLIALFENALSARSSILFYIRKDLFEDSVMRISSFFSSITINKQEKIMSKLIDFESKGIKKYERLIHEDFSSWSANINQILDEWD